MPGFGPHGSMVQRSGRVELTGLGLVVLVNDVVNLPGGNIPHLYI